MPYKKSRKNDSLVWFMGWWHHRSIFLQRRPWKKRYRQRRMTSSYDTRLFFLPQLAEFNLVDMCFHQDGATCHTARETMEKLKDDFGEQLISRNGPASWPLRSCDLTPFDYFLWGYVKSLVYVDKPNTIEALQDNITRVIRGIQANMLEKVIESSEWTIEPRTAYT